MLAYRKLNSSAITPDGGSVRLEEGALKRLLTLPVQYETLTSCNELLVSCRIGITMHANIDVAELASLYLSKDMLVILGE